ncbi:MULTISPECIES: hypothetical protein [unclassified Nocardiopsis]|uniref:hypothetical protein n=1 Tax=Nocardiopsis TaxID=2013 RepID=UPI00387B93EB
MKKRAFKVLASTMAAAGVAAFAVGMGLGERGPAEQDVLLVHGVDHLPSETASDWVTYADHVVVVSVAAEKEIPPTELEIARGEGLIGRELTLDVETVLWSQEDAPPAPDTWTYPALGYVFTEGDIDGRTPMALAGHPRVESGHRYIMAIVWEEARCSPGDVPDPAGWRGLGQGSEVPFDDGVIGQGELEGRVDDGSEARQGTLDAHGAEGSLEELLAGQDGDALVRALESATPQPATFAAQTIPEHSCD